jgi:hypothetical protein
MLRSSYEKILTDLADEKVAKNFLKNIWHEGLRFDEAKDLEEIDRLKAEEAVSLSKTAFPIYYIKNFPAYGRWQH